MSLPNKIDMIDIFCIISLLLVPLFINLSYMYNNHFLQIIAILWIYNDTLNSYGEVQTWFVFFDPGSMLIALILSIPRILYVYQVHQNRYGFASRRTVWKYAIICLIPTTMLFLLSVLTPYEGLRLIIPIPLVVILGMLIAKKYGVDTTSDLWVDSGGHVLIREDTW